jgi:hypothetical protein
MRKLPIDTSTFSELIQSNYLYVDKTQHVYNLITGGRRFFLSRPRRFGKSLFVSTLKEVLTANKVLFDGLWIKNSDYQWHEYGAIDLDFSKLKTTDVATFNNRLWHALATIAKYYQISISVPEDAPDLMLEKLTAALYERFGRVAILIDEYDSPILKTLHNEPLSREIRNTIQHFFTLIKGLDAQVQFVFITGVSSFAKAGLFSGINNLQILTLRDEYATICGYTDAEIDHYFSDYITGWAHKKNLDRSELRQQIKSWYNGYHFGENVEAVYNPFSFMNALNVCNFENFWFQSGTPTFLVEVLKKNEHTFDPENLTTSRDALGIFDVGLTPLTTLMFQAGYLTIVGYDSETERYLLDYPNNEVRISFQKYLLEVFAHISSNNAEQLYQNLKAAFIKQDIEQVVLLLQRLFAHVPYQLHMRAEKYYHSLFMMICIGAGIKAQSEYSTSHGRIDLILEFPKTIYVIEVKFNDTAANALAQIEERRYYDRFMNQDKRITLLGLAFKRTPKIFDITYVTKEIG